MAQQKLTTVFIQNIKKRENKSLDVFWDSLIPGFGVRIYPSLRKTFILCFRINQKQKFITLGNVSDISLSEARSLAREELRKAKSGQYSSSMNFHDFWYFYVQNYIEKRRKVSRDEKRRFNVLNAYLGSKRLQEIKTIDILKIHTEISKKAPYEANRILSLVTTMFDRAIEWECVQGRNPAKGIKKNEEKSRDRYLTEEEMPAFLKALDSEKNIYAKNAIFLLLLTAARKSEILELKWENVDLKNEVVYFKQPKNKRDHIVHLSKDALYIFNQIPKQKNNPYVICGKNKGSHLVNLSKPWIRVCDKANITNARIHDTRRTVASWLVNRGCSLEVIMSLLNQKHRKSVLVYAHVNKANQKKAVELHSSSLFGFKQNALQAA